MVREPLLEQGRELAQVRRYLEDRDAPLDDGLGQKVGHVLKDLGSHERGKLLARVLASGAHDPDQELSRLDGRQARVVLLDVDAKEAVGAHVDVDLLLGVLDDDGVRGAPLELVHIVSVDEVDHRVKGGGAAGERVRHVAKRRKAAISGVQLDLARPDEHADLGVPRSGGIKGASRLHVVGEDRHLRLGHVEVGAVGEVLVGIAEGHERGASLVARLPLDVVYRKRTQNARVLLFLGVLAVEQGHGCIPPARRSQRDGTRHLAMVRRTGSGRFALLFSGRPGAVDVSSA